MPHMNPPMTLKKLTFSQKRRPFKTEWMQGSGTIYRREWLDTLLSLGKEFALVTDDTVKELHALAFTSYLQENGCSVHLFTIPPGERYKSRYTKETLEDQFLSQGLGRSLCVIAMGGGVITDLAGFLAATYCRGIPLTLIPTTLLGMVDASIGGKTGVNTPLGKNLIGAFYPPHSVAVDIDLLKTLPGREWLNGLAEMLKYGLILAPALFNALSAFWKQSDNTLLLRWIHESYEIKKRVIEADFEERGLRRILNFGHTIGHALELVEDFTIPHGEAIILGMLCEGYISMRLGYLSCEELKTISTAFRLLGFPLKLSKKAINDSLITALSLDKKSVNGSPRFVLLDKIGAVVPFEGEYCSAVAVEVIREAITWMLCL